MLTCACPDGFDAEWYYTPPEDYETVPHRISNRRFRCASCRSLIEHGSTVIRFERSRPARFPIEERIYGEDDDAVPMPALFWCERCADLYWSLTELGFCVGPEDNALKLAKEYAEMNHG